MLPTLNSGPRQEIRGELVCYNIMTGGILWKEWQDTLRSMPKD